MADLDDVLLEYYRAAQAGRRPTREELIARHPELAAELAAFLDDERRLLCGLDAASAPSSPPTSFGGYEILGEIARGGMGVVYRARQKSLGRVVALKVILSGALATPEEVRRFRREAEAAAALEHPHIVPIHEVGEVEGRPYFTMKLLEGGNLAQALPRYAGDFRAAAGIVETVAWAVQLAHEHGVLHRDLKPSNVLFDLDGRPYVSDFGLAKRLGPDASVSETAAAVGTPRYMSPEQAAGDTKAISTVSDVYGLGLILYELLAGRGPFEAPSTPELLRQIAERAPPPPSRLRPGVPRDLETIALKCLEKQPGRRYASACALAGDLRAFLEDRPISARPARAWERAWRWARRRPAAAALVGVSLLALISLTVLGFGYSYSLRLRVEELDRFARHATHAYRMQLALEAWSAGRCAQADRVLLDLVPAPGEEDLRSFEWTHLYGALHQERSWLEDPGGSVEPIPWRVFAFSPDGRLFARVTPRGEIVLLDGRVEAPASVLGGRLEGGFRGVAISRDGALLAAAGKETVRLYDLRAERMLWEAVPAGAAEAREILDIEIAPDGRRVAVRWGDDEVMLLDAADGRAAGAVRARWHVVRFAPDGRSIAARVAGGGESSHDLQLLSLATGDEVFRLAGHTKVVVDVAFVAEGRWCVTASHDGTVRFWDLRQGRALGDPLQQGSAVAAFAVTLDGARIATADLAGTVRVWDRGSGKLERTFWTDPRNIRIAFSPDGRLLVAAGGDGLLKVWDLSRPGDGSSLPPGEAPIWTGGFAADGSLVTAADDFTVTRWRLLADGSARKERAVNANPEGKYICGSLSRDGTLGVAGTKGGDVEVLDLLGAAPEGVTPVARLRARQASVYGADFSPDARWIVAGYLDGWVAIWRRGAGGELSSWELVTATSLGLRVRGFSFSPDGGLVAMSCPDHKQVFLHELATGRSLALPPAREPVFVTAFHPRQPLLACALYRGTIELWRIERTGAGLEASPWGTLEGHGTAAEALSFSPDASVLLSGAGDATVRIWDLIETPRGGMGFLRATMRGFEGRLLAVGFSPDGRTLFTSETGAAGARGIVRLWGTATLEEVAARRVQAPER